MESLDHNLRLPGLDAAALPTVARPTAPSTILPEGGAFADLLARAEAPEPKSSPKRDVAETEPVATSKKVESRQGTEEVARKETPSTQREEAKPTERKNEDEPVVDEAASAKVADDAQRETETAVKDDPAPVREEAVVDERETVTGETEPVQVEGQVEAPQRADDQAPVPVEGAQPVMITEDDDQPMAHDVAPQAITPSEELLTTEPTLTPGAAAPEVQEAVVQEAVVQESPLPDVQAQPKQVDLPLETTVVATEQAPLEADPLTLATEDGIVSDPHLAVRATAGKAERVVKDSDDAPVLGAAPTPVAPVTEGTVEVPAQLQAAVQAAGMATADVPVESPVEAKPNLAMNSLEAVQPQQVLAEGEAPTLTTFAPILDAEGATLTRSKVASTSSEGISAVAATGTESKEASTQRTQTNAPRTVADPEALQRAEQVLDQLRVKLSPKVRQASLTLRPSELGRLMVNIEVDGGKLTARMIAEKPESLVALQQHIPELKAMLEQRGLEVQNIELSLAQDGTSFDLNAGSGQSNGEGNPGTKPGGSADLGDDVSLTQSLTRAIASEDALDLYA